MSTVGTTFIATGLESGTNYQFFLKAINNVGKSVSSQIITISTAACLVIPDPTFQQPPINYIIGTSAVPFSIPTYTTSSGCPSSETVNIFRCVCAKGVDSNYLEWYPAPDWIIPPSGGSISENNTSFVGSYICKVSANTQSYFDESFSFSLTMTLPTAPDPPTNLIRDNATTNFT